MWSWQKGRQGTGYENFKIFEFSWPFGCDCYLIRYTEGIELPFHRDPVKTGFKHLRLNIILIKPSEGGEFVIRGIPIINWNRLKLFRPDRDEHGMTKLLKGRRLLFNLGWLMRE